MPTLVLYALLQIPGILLVGLLLLFAVQRGWMTADLAWILIGLWLLKDVVLYPFYRFALKHGRSPGPDAMIGRVGLALTDIPGTGLVLCEGEQWQARNATDEFIGCGESVQVVAHERLTLVVRRLEATQAKADKRVNPGPV